MVPLITDLLLRERLDLGLGGFDIAPV